MKDKAPLPAFRTWTEAVDAALKLLEGMSSCEAGAVYGFGYSTIWLWRKKRALGLPISMVQRSNRRSLARLFASRAEWGGPAPRTRRRPGGGAQQR